MNPGQYLNPGDPVATLTALDNLFVNFTLPQQELGKLHVGGVVEVSADAFPGRVYKLSVPDGKVLGYFGKSGHQAKQFGWIHEIACPSENEIYVAELLNWRLQKITMKPAAAKSSSAGK